MKFEEFRELVEKRKTLIKRVNVGSNIKRIKEIDQKIHPVKYEMYHTLENDRYLSYMKTAYTMLFEVGHDNLIKMLRIYFHDSAELSFSLDGQALFVNVYEGKQSKVYSLGLHNNNLSCLFCNAGEDWEEMLTDFPALKEYFWLYYKNYKQQYKKDQIRLLEKMIEERNNEQTILETPELRDAKIKEIKTEKTKFENMIDLINESLDDIEL